jgi:hypothetical protein
MYTSKANKIAMDPNATKEARVEALQRAKSHNLDVALIARETVRLTLEEAFAVSWYQTHVESSS